MKKTVLLSALLMGALFAQEKCFESLEKYWKEKGVEVNISIYDEGSSGHYKLYNAAIDFVPKTNTKFIQVVGKNGIKRKDIYLCVNGVVVTDIAPFSAKSRASLEKALFSMREAKLAKNDVFRINKPKRTDLYIVGTFDIVRNPSVAQMFLLADEGEPPAIFLIPLTEERMNGKLIRKMDEATLKENALFALGIRNMDEKTKRSFVDAYMKNASLKTIIAFYKKHGISVDADEYRMYISLSKKLGTFVSFIKKISNPVGAKEIVYTTGIFEEK